MFKWLFNKSQGDRYLANLSQLEAGLINCPPDRRAKIVILAMDFVENMRVTDTERGIGLAFEQAVLQMTGTSAEAAGRFFILVEDLLASGEKEINQRVRRAGRGAASESDVYLNEESAVYQLALRLLMVTLARKADSEFATKTSRVGALVYEAQESLDSVINLMEQQQKITQSITPDARNMNFEILKQNTSLFLSITALTW